MLFQRGAILIWGQISTGLQADIRDLACFGLGLPEEDKYYLHYINVH